MAQRRNTQHATARHAMAKRATRNSKTRNGATAKHAVVQRQNAQHAMAQFCSKFMAADRYHSDNHGGQMLFSTAVVVDGYIRFIHSGSCSIHDLVQPYSCLSQYV